MKRLLALLFLLLLPTAALADPPSYQDSCRTWLGLVDSGRYAESWDTAGPYFQSKITKDQWLALIKYARDAVGTVLSRGAAQVTPTDRLPDAPFGKYIVITIKTKFQLNPDATETIVLKSEDGAWKVAGYFIK